MSKRAILEKRAAYLYNKKTLKNTKKGCAKKMDFNAYSSEVLEWLEGVRKNRGTDAEKTLMLCKK